MSAHDQHSLSAASPFAQMDDASVRRFADMAYQSLVDARRALQQCTDTSPFWHNGWGARALTEIDKVLELSGDATQQDAFFHTYYIYAAALYFADTLMPGGGRVREPWFVCEACSHFQRDGRGELPGVCAACGQNQWRLLTWADVEKPVDSPSNL